MEFYQKNNLLKYFSLQELEKIFIEKDLYQKACLLIEKLFQNKLDKEGDPYIGHLYRVANRLNNPMEKVAALLHDTLEDTEITYEDLELLGFSKEVLDIVNLVTKKKIDKTGMTKAEKLKIYEEEIDSIINSGNIYAIHLKIADMSDNYDLERLKKLPIEKQKWFHEKYSKQLEKLKKVIGED